jgi:hypothetical protein
MLRYKTSKARRPPMPKDRRMVKIETLFNKYERFLQELGLKVNS